MVFDQMELSVGGRQKNQSLNLCLHGKEAKGYGYTDCTHPSGSWERRKSDL